MTTPGNAQFPTGSDAPNPAVAGARNAGSFALAESPLFVADDADGRPCVWINAGNPNGADALLRSIDIPAVGRDALWAHITKGLPRRHEEDRPLADSHHGLRGHANARKRADS